MGDGFNSRVRRGIAHLSGGSLVTGVWCGVVAPRYVAHHLFDGMRARGHLWHWLLLATPEVSYPRDTKQALPVRDIGVVRCSCCTAVASISRKGSVVSGA
ncbi:hypothetical protein BS78_09G161300 [Paspalum vaginatum]|nr:hypothetical protein BS78_09G161300 [Paspalum vaginatum]